MVLGLGQKRKEGAYWRVQQIGWTIGLGLEKMNWSLGRS